MVGCEFQAGGQGQGRPGLGGAADSVGKERPVVGEPWDPELGAKAQGDPGACCGAPAWRLLAVFVGQP